MNENENMVEAASEDYDEILPDGWSGAEGEDIFDPSTWGLTGDQADASDDEDSYDEGEDAGNSDVQTRTTEENEGAETNPEGEQNPTTDLNSSEGGKLRFPVTVNHVSQEVELDTADLPGVYQRSLMMEKYQQRVANLEAELSAWDSLAAGLKYESRNALRDGLFEAAVQDFVSEHPSIPEEMARDYVTRQFNIKNPEPAAKADEPKQEENGGRDYKKEVAELFRAYPNARTERIPEEVTNDALASNKPLVQAYADWKAKTASAKATRAERENKILKQNQAAAAKAPVSKVTGGGKTDTSPEDPFLQGFNDDSAW